MRQLWVLFAFAIALGECRRHHSGNEGETSTNCGSIDANNYVDRLLEKARKDLPDPMRLPPRSTIVELSDGVLWGMSELTRVGEADVTCEGNKITIKATLTVDQLKGRYTWTKVRKGKSDKEGYVVVISDDFQAKVEIVIEKHENEQTHPRLAKFVINKFEKTDVQISGGMLPWAFGEVASWFTGIFSRVVASTIQDPITEALERQMREITIE